MSETTQRAIGQDYIGMARMIEATVEGVSDHTVAFKADHNKEELKHAMGANMKLLGAARLLRQAGNSMLGG
jgi:hypothetical protein